jgi:RNA polymerase sigma-54 factor
MALEQRLHLKLAQKLVMTPTLQQAIKLLQLSRLELEQAIDQETQTNPLLELTEDSAGEEETNEGADGAAQPVEADASGAEPASATATEQPVEEGESTFAEVDIDALFGNYLHDTPTTASSWEDEEDLGLQNMPARDVGLFENLYNQVRLLEIAPTLLPICEFVIGNIESDGYLRTSVADLATQLAVDEQQIERAVFVVQKLEPPGVGARSLQECFLLQIDRRWGSHPGPAWQLARRVVAEGLDDLLHQRWDRISQRLGVNRDDLKDVLEVIRHLDPKPGNSVGSPDNPAVEPDLIVSKERGQWRVVLNDDGLPKLRISARYLRMLKSGVTDGDAKGYLRERMRSALWFLRSVDQRQNTILRVGNAIVRRQEDFLDHGISGLRPLVLRDIADDIGMHESTVSRVVSNKYISTPRGVLPLKFFFHSAISHALEGDISSMIVKERIKNLITEEDPAHPLSDARVARQLNRLGIRIARRTVAKYREELGLPSSEQRRRALR